jgi:CubicO group peptidase (beta-lactamase class C family)
VRRITGKSLGQFFADEVAAPLGLSAWIGLPEEREGRAARMEFAAPFTMEEMTAGLIENTGLDRDTVIAWMNAVWGPDSVQARAGQLGGAFERPGRLRLRHEPVVIPDRRTASVEPGGGGHGLPA